MLPRHPRLDELTDRLRSIVDELESAAGVAVACPPALLAELRRAQGLHRAYSYLSATPAASSPAHIVQAPTARALGSSHIASVSPSPVGVRLPSEARPSVPAHPSRTTSRVEVSPALSTPSTSRIRSQGDLRRSLDADATSGDHTNDEPADGNVRIATSDTLAATPLAPPEVSHADSCARSTTSAAPDSHALDPPSPSSRIPRQSVKGQPVLPTPPASFSRRCGPFESPSRGDVFLSPVHQASSFESAGAEDQLNRHNLSSSDAAEGERPPPAGPEVGSDGDEVDSDGDDDAHEPYKPPDTDAEMDEELDQVELDDLDEDMMDLFATGDEAVRRTLISARPSTPAADRVFVQKRARSDLTDESDAEEERRKRRKNKGKKSSTAHESRQVRLPKNGILAPRSPLAVFTNQLYALGQPGIQQQIGDIVSSIRPRACRT
ncbi:hypothetical protein RTBOTA2_000162 [Rhodotorula toruloides]|uniref:Uncharacterized protein n=1 Tax=Rhodotorula toruloides TaxID=5286 RepID=A0A2T0AGJ7_RHOTO|nr:hypothetical protein RTBOTA2_000162 [Rhodotorula toruloides]PRQ77115.1 hypothetical protein AAT19DRAFT_12533 [Rhodotorula toruloides]